MFKTNIALKNIRILFVLCALPLLMVQCRKAQPYDEDNIDERLSGGQMTIFDQTAAAYGRPYPVMAAYDNYMHGMGDAIFEKSFVTAPAPINSGLGPAYNNVSCISCHHNDGKGVPTCGEVSSSMLFRISQTGTNEHGAPLAVPGYGTQIQDKAVFGQKPEAKINISYSYQSYSFSDGEKYELRVPHYELTNLYIPINVPYMLSPRLAPPIFGLGLLEAVSEADILTYADPDDLDQDGISGKPNYVWDVTTKSRQLGRFGLKANTASVLTQVVSALNDDMGITTSILPNESTHGQLQYDDLDDDPELPDSLLEPLKFYLQSLAVPARRNVTNPTVLRGKQLFMEAKCGACHRPEMRTSVNVVFKGISNQRIMPYTDMLLHDMGEGLADNRPDFLASGNEWRTPPLWGIGLAAIVNYPGYFLHDGRARTLTEAIMWHGGEAEKSKEKFATMSKQDRDALLSFLKSL